MWLYRDVTRTTPCMRYRNILCCRHRWRCCHMRSKCCLLLVMIMVMWYIMSILHIRGKWWLRWMFRIVMGSIVSVAMVVYWMRLGWGMLWCKWLREQFTIAIVAFVRIECSRWCLLLLLLLLCGYPRRCGSWFWRRRRMCMLLYPNMRMSLPMMCLFDNKINEHNDLITIKTYGGSVCSR